MLEPIIDPTFAPLPPFMAARGLRPGQPYGSTPPGAVRAALVEASSDVRAIVRASGTPAAVATCDLITLPYPTRFGLWRAASTPVPFLWFTNRMIVVQWDEPQPAGGTRPRTMLWEPSDHERGENTPYFARLKARSPLPDSLLRTIHGTVLTRLRALGVDPDDVDYLSFDHLHTQDVRRLVGTRGPAPDLSHSDQPVAPWFPNARLLVQVREWETLRHLHPLQAPWYQPETYEDLPPERLLFIDGDVVVGPGVALVYTPGHTYGNQSLVLNTSSGIWTSSENGVAAECWAPHASRIPGVRRWAAEWRQEVVLNANTIEFTAWQYDSMVAEAAVADPTPDGDFRQTFPSSELTSHRLAPGTAPTFTHGAIRHGRVRASSQTSSAA